MTPRGLTNAGPAKYWISQTHPPCPIRLLQMRPFCCTSRWLSLSYWGCLQCCSETGAAGPGQTTSGGACFIFSQLLSWCFKHGSVATAVSPCSNQVCERRPAKLATSAASSSTGFNGCSTTRAPCGFSGCSIPSLVFLLLGHGGDSHPLHDQYGTSANPSSGFPPASVPIAFRAGTLHTVLTNIIDTVRLRA